MNITAIQNYLSQTLDCDITLSVQEQKGLPFFVQKMFHFFSGTIYGIKIYLLLATDDFFDDHSIADLESTAAIFRTKVPDGRPIFVFDSLARRQRQMLVKRRFAFIVPSAQMFLPSLGIDFSERIKEDIPHKPEMLTPLAQAILVEQLLSGKIQGKSFARISEMMSCSIPSVMRAVDLLRKRDLCMVHSDGYRKSVLFDSDRKILWDSAAKYLKSPVRKVLHVINEAPFQGNPYAGEYALSRQTNLAAKRKCYAILDSEYSKLNKAGAIVIADSDRGGTADVEVWAYTQFPTLNGEMVDTFSLELSFKNTSDARIMEALLEIKEKRQW